LFVFWVGAAHSLVYILFCISLFVFWVGAAHSLVYITNPKDKQCYTKQYIKNEQHQPKRQTLIYKTIYKE
jgi:hypothetical protein